MSELQGVIVGQRGRKGKLQIYHVVNCWQGSEQAVEVYTSRVSGFKLTPKSRYGRASTWEENPSNDDRMRCSGGSETVSIHVYCGNSKMVKIFHAFF